MKDFVIFLRSKLRKQYAPAIILIYENTFTKYVGDQTKFRPQNKNFLTQCVNLKKTF